MGFGGKKPSLSHNKRWGEEGGIMNGGIVGSSKFFGTVVNVADELIDEMLERD